MSFWSDLKLTQKPLAGFVLIGIAWACFFAQMPAIKARIGASDGTYGAVLLVASGGALLAMWLAPLAERYLGRWGLPLAGLCVGFGMLGSGLSTGLVGFGLSMGLAAMGAGVVDVLINVRVSEIETRTGRNLMNLNHGIYSMSYAGAAVFTGVLREVGWSPLQVFAWFMILVVILCVRMLPRRTVEVPAPATSQARSMPGGLILLSGLVVMLAFLAESSSEGWSALHLERTLGGGPAEGALGPAILGLTMGIGRLSGHFVGHIWPEDRMMRFACLLSVIGLVLVASATGLWMAYAGFALAGLGLSVVAPLALASLGRTVPPEVRLVAITRASVLGYGAFFIGPPLMGLTAELFGLRMGFAVIAALMLLTVVLILPALDRALLKWAN
ncbi:MAG: MFS transporter [Pseudomonadota bacterium]